MKHLFISIVLAFITLNSCSQNSNCEELKTEIDKLKNENTTLITDNKNLNQQFCIAKLSVLKSKLYEAHSLMKSWTNSPASSDAPYKIRANSLIDKSIESDLEEITQIFKSQKVSAIAQEKFSQIHADIMQLIKLYDNIRETLPNFTSYEDPINSFMVQTSYDEEITPMFESIIKDLDSLTLD